MSVEIKDNKLLVSVSHEFVSQNIRNLRTEIEDSLSSQPIDGLILDFTEVTFIDNSCIGFILWCYKAVKDVVIKNASQLIKHVLMFSGVQRLVRIQ